MTTAERGGRRPEERIWTPANIVTMVRICLVPVFVIALISPWPEWFGADWLPNGDKSSIAAGIFIVISCTDWLDGYLARSRNEVTAFGKFMDPLADKILVTAALLALIELGTLPSWVVLIIVAREFIVSGVRMVAANEGVVIAASYYGKFKTVFQMIAIVMFTVKDSHMVGSAGQAFGDGLWVASWAVMIVALALTIVSMVDYVAKARVLLGLRRKEDAPEAVLRTQADEVVMDLAATADAEEGRSVAGVGEGRPCGDDVGPDSLEARIGEAAARVVRAAVRAGTTVGTAESLTGGLIVGALTSVPGSSAVVRGGIVSYATEVKESLLRVPVDVVIDEGVVSQEVACAMAAGAATQLGCSLSVAVTGIAGPGGAEPGKPVGTVWMALVSPEGSEAFECHFEGDRESVRAQTVLAALGKLEDALTACRR